MARTGDKTTQFSCSLLTSLTTKKSLNLGFHEVEPVMDIQIQGPEARIFKN